LDVASPPVAGDFVGVGDTRTVLALRLELVGRIDAAAAWKRLSASYLLRYIDLQIVGQGGAEESQELREEGRRGVCVGCFEGDYGVGE
jgi:hypothetical protein